MEEFAAKSEAKSVNEGDVETNDKENFKTPQIFIDQLFQLYKNGLVDDKMIEDQVALMIFGVRFLDVGCQKRSHIYFIF